MVGVLMKTMRMSKVVLVAGVSLVFGLTIGFFLGYGNALDSIAEKANIKEIYKEKIYILDDAQYRAYQETGKLPQGSEEL